VRRESSGQDGSGSSDSNDDDDDDANGVALRLPGADMSRRALYRTSSLERLQIVEVLYLFLFLCFFVLCYVFFVQGLVNENRLGRALDSSIQDDNDNDNQEEEADDEDDDDDDDDTPRLLAKFDSDVSDFFRFSTLRKH
jgi:hypothetical protein